jgi:hypothetical protein
MPLLQNEPSIGDALYAFQPVFLEPCFKLSHDILLMQLCAGARCVADEETHNIYRLYGPVQEMQQHPASTCALNQYEFSPLVKSIAANVNQASSAQVPNFGELDIIHGQGLYKFGEEWAHGMFTSFTIFHRLAVFPVILPDALRHRETRAISYCHTFGNQYYGEGCIKDLRGFKEW